MIKKSNKELHSSTGSIQGACGMFEGAAERIKYAAREIDISIRDKCDRRLDTILEECEWMEIRLKSHAKYLKKEHMKREE